LAYSKRHEECVLFLEDAFSQAHAQKLRNADFKVRCFADDFLDENGQRQIGVADPVIIRHCHSNQLVLVTTDKNIRYTHVNAIKKTDIAIIATESSKGDMEVWVNALILARAKILSKVKRHPRPWFGTISRAGELRHIITITAEMNTRRRRPKEQDA
jgi:hypothetical protein